MAGLIASKIDSSPQAGSPQAESGQTGTSPRAGRQTKRFEFLLLPEFSMMAFTASIEPLRAANRVAGETLYEWQVATVDGGPVAASNGVSVQPECSLAELSKSGVFVVCAGLNPEDYVTSSLKAELRKLSRKAEAVGAVCTGSEVLAEAGLLDGYRCTIHWEDIASFSENFPLLDITSRLFEIDRDRFTSSGGTAPLDLMIHFIALEHGRDLAANVGELLVHQFAREAHDPQRISILERTGVKHPGLLQAIAVMEDAIEQPVPLVEVAGTAGLSPRQMERLFKSHFTLTPSAYYRRLRLVRARHLLAHSALSITQVALASGFTSAAHFTKCYRENYGSTPTAERRALQDARMGPLSRVSPIADAAP